MKNYKTFIILIAAIAAVIILCIFTVQHSGNRAIGYEEGVESAKADVNAQLQRRYNVLSELAECIKQYDSHEYETLTAVIEARGSNITDSEADEVMAQINAVAEAYPELKSQENYKQFMTEISTTENLIAQYKQAYNSSIKEYNRFVKKFPHKQFLSLAGYEVISYEYYSSDKTDSEPVTFFN